MSDEYPSARWAPDPMGRHELRYWNGAEWTDHVADRGVQATDPLVPAPPPPVPEPPVDAPTEVVPTATVPTATPELLSSVVSPAPPQPPPPMAGTGIDPRVGTAAAAGPGQWRSLTGLRTALVVLLVCAGVAALAVAVAVSNRLSVIDDLENGRFTFDLIQRANDADDAVDATAAVLVLITVATAIVWIIWQWRCAKNAEVLGNTAPRFGPGWSIGAWFIPLANFVIPVLIVQDLWRASAPGARPGTWRKERGSALIGFWWAAFLLGAVLMQATGEDDATLDELRTTNGAALAGVVATAIAAVLAVVLVVQLTRRFEERASGA